MNQLFPCLFIMFLWASLFVCESKLECILRTGHLLSHTWNPWKILGTKWRIQAKLSRSNKFWFSSAYFFYFYFFFILLLANFYFWKGDKVVTTQFWDFRSISSVKLFGKSCHLSYTKFIIISSRALLNGKSKLY